jgi:hypothetical protein
VKRRGEVDRTGNSTLFWTKEKRCRFSILSYIIFLIKNISTSLSSSSSSSITTGKLTFFDHLVGVFEYEVDGNGNTGGKIWEQK